jgi:hypothetical protein
MDIHNINVINFEFKIYCVTLVNELFDFVVTITKSLTQISKLLNIDVFVAFFNCLK